MRIVHTEASCGWGGQEIRILEEARGLIARGHQVVVLCPAESKIYAEGPRRGVPTEALPIRYKRLGGWWALRRWLAGHEADVVNTHSSADTWLAALACKTLRRPPPLVRTRHISAPIPQSATSRWLYARAVCQVVTTGEDLRLQVMRETGVAPERIRSIPTGVDMNRYCPGDAALRRRELGLPADKLLLGIVATLRSWKGHEHLLAALARLARDDVLLVVVGDGPQRARLEALAAAPDLAGRVRFVGQQQDVAPWFQALDLAVLPSYANEGVPQSLIQAMACGIPVVSTPVGAIGELVQDGDTGRLVPPADPVALAAAIADLLDRPEERARLAGNGLARVRARHGLDRMVERMEEVFRQAAGDGR